MAIIRKIRNSFSRHIKLRKVRSEINRMSDILGKRGSYFTSFAYTSITRLKAIRDVSAEEFEELVTQEVEKLHVRYREYRWS